MVVESANLPKRGIEVHIANLTTRQARMFLDVARKVTGGPCTVLARCNRLAVDRLSYQAD